MWSQELQTIEEMKEYSWPIKGGPLEREESCGKHAEKRYVENVDR